MAMVQEGIYTHLIGDSSITALVSTRVRHVTAPQGTSELPCIVITRVSGVPSQHQLGEIGLNDTRLQLDCWASLPIVAARIADAVRVSLGSLVKTTFTVGEETIDVDRVVVEDVRAAFQSPFGGQEATMYREMVEARVWFRETPAADPNS